GGRARVGEHGRAFGGEREALVAAVLEHAGRSLRVEPLAQPALLQTGRGGELGAAHRLAPRQRAVQTEAVAEVDHRRGHRAAQRAEHEAQVVLQLLGIGGLAHGPSLHGYALGMAAEKTRIERDSLGEIAVPADALWGASTQRAVENFPISGERFPRVFLQALGLVKRAAAHANAELGVLEADVARAIADAADEVASGALDAHFPLDVFQTGSGTSTNTNANEVIAARARARLGKPVATHEEVKARQTSNDRVPHALPPSAQT